MNCASTKDVGLAQQADGGLVLVDLGFLVELVEFQLRRGLRPQTDMHEPRLDGRTLSRSRSR